MRLADGNGLDVIREWEAKRPDARGIILTGYGNIVTAVTAVKLGAFDYLAKPVDADEIFNALMATRHDKAELPENPMSADRGRGGVRGFVFSWTSRVDADKFLNALGPPRHDKAELPENPMSADRVRWEHIQRIYELCGRNVSETARRLNMHRRTLQRILAKKAPRRNRLVDRRVSTRT